MSISEIEKIEYAVEALSQEFSAYNLSFGYIGSLQNWGDERGWGVFVTPRVGGECRMFGAFPTSKLANLHSLIQDGGFHRWLDVQRDWY